LKIRTTIDPTEKNGNVVHVSDKVAYYSDSKIGEGSFGAVYKGYLEDPKRPMAVKMMKNEELNNYKSKELDILMTVDHANVIKYYITIKKKDFSYIVMDLADTTLHDLVLRRKPKASYEVLVKLCKDAAMGLAELHRRKIIHRDIKPSNVLVFESKNPIPIAKLADFGISRIIGEDKDAFTTKYGNTGTRTFMPPEALNAPTNSPYKLTTYFDIFSLGILIGFAMTEGRNLFSDTKTSGTEQIHANITFYRPNWTIVSSLQLTALKNLLQTMLHKEPQKRSTARCVLEHPFFWGHKEGLMFILGVSNDAKSIGKSKTAKEISLNDELSKTYQRYCSEQIKEGVPITSNWKSRLDENIRNWIQKKDAELQGQKKPQGPKGWRMYKENSLVELVNFIRDQNEHTENWVTEKEVTRPDLFGRQGSNYGPYFLKTFPELTTLLYTLLQDPQLRNAQTVHTNLFYSENTNICFQNWRPLK
jgi:serine/threonine protein kinase